MNQKGLNNAASFLSLTPLGLIMTLTLPSALFVTVNASSMSVPLTALALLWYAIAFGTLHHLHRADGTVIVICGVISAIIVIHAALSNQITQTVDFQRMAYSLVMMTIDTVAALLAARCLMNTNPRSLIKAVDFGLALLAVIGFASLLGVPAIGPNHSVKPVIIFSEPSHFGLAYLPLLLFRLSTCSWKAQIWWLGLSAVLGAAIESLTIVAGVFLFACMLLRSTSLILLVICAGFGALAVDLTYYVSRLTLTSDSDNLSTLVFLQGWDNAQINFRETYGLGVGFAQFGIAGSTGEIADRISILAGTSLSLYDGGSTATKLVGEFGIIGVLIAILLAMRMIKAAKYVRRSQALLSTDREITSLFFSSVIASYVVEFFMKGMGYFSPGTFLLLVGLYGFAMQRQRLRAMQPSAGLIQ